VFRLSMGSKNNQTPEKMLMYEVFSLLLCDMRRNLSSRSVTIDTVRLLKNQIKTKLEKSKLAREESGASADDCSARRMLDGVANVYE